MKTGLPLQIEEVADLKDGHHVFLANKFPLVDTSGRVYGVCTISHDITDRKQAEEALRHAEKELRGERDRIREYMNIAEVLLMVLDREGRVTLMNRKGCEILGL
jgi:PAS domain-containing protein